MVDTSGVVGGKRALLADKVLKLRQANNKDKAKLSKARTANEIRKIQNRINGRRVEIGSLSRRLEKMPKTED